MAREMNPLIRGELSIDVLPDLGYLTFKRRILFTTSSVTARQLILKTLKLIL